MKVLKKYDFIWKFFVFILILTFVMTIINLISPLKQNINSLLSLLGILMYSLIAGIRKGVKTDAKGYKEGFKIGFVYVAVLYFLGALSLHFAIPLKRFLYFVIIIVTTILGSVIGINKKNSK